MKKLFITIDTEGDNLWSWKPGDPIATENTKYLERFQNLANRYGFKPVWLSNYEMISDPRYLEFIAKVEDQKAGELGMHLHAWNTPPLYDLPVEKNGAPYLIEYPEEVMEEKIATMTELILSRTGIRPVSHRAGRWATDDRYFRLLGKYGYHVDCSVTPGKDWTETCGQTASSHGSDYSSCPKTPYWISKDLLEVPVSIGFSHRFFRPPCYNPRKLAGVVIHALQGQELWLRPNGWNLGSMKHFLDKTLKGDAEYIMFMLHSSEMMPGGSPTFRTEESIDKMYKDTEEVFRLASENYEGMTLRDYYSEKRKSLLDN